MITPAGCPRRGEREEMATFKHETTNRIVNTKNNINHQDHNWKQITNKYKNTCCVCNRSITIGDIILWHKEEKLVMHLPEVCKFLGTRKKMPKRRKIQDSGEFPVTVTQIVLQ